MAMHRLAAVVAVAAGLALVGCGSDGDSSMPPGLTASDGGGSSEGAGPVGLGGPSGPEDPNVVFTELAHRMADGDAEGVCQLFTEAGQMSFAVVYEMSTCEGAADKASALIEDKAAVASWTFEGRGLDVSGDTAVLEESCRDTQPGGVEWGSVTLSRTDDGWLITSMEPDSAFSSCGG
jgi:hypothetical protein